ncbi:MAG: MBOAT family protein [Planctomycetota bacterium]|nr:MBOAT family protein [Planctomycetota bacterium]
MASVTESRVAQNARLAAWLPLVVLPVVVIQFASEWPSWVLMWVVAFSIYAGLKWLSFVDGFVMSKSAVGRSLGYLLLWPGMDAKSFSSSSRHIERPRLNEWLMAVANLALGVALVVVAVQFVDRVRMLAEWIGMAGIVFTMHFGVFHLLSVIWREAGVDAPAIMNAPILSSSLSEFWGKRWNLAFRDLAHTFVFRPGVGKLGITGATMVVFVVSGLVHDAVISIPAGGGWGLPTLYFVIQGVGVLFERSRLGKRLGTRRGVIGWLFCATVTLGPVFLLFHRHFLERVVVPMLTAIGSLWS